jgi:hypothetical protein
MRSASDLNKKCFKVSKETLYNLRLKKGYVSGTKTTGHGLMLGKPPFPIYFLITFSFIS